MIKPGHDNAEFIAPDPFALAVDVRDADIDDFGHVNNVAYLGWIARLRLRRHFQICLHGTGTTLAFSMSDFATIKISTGRACRMPAEFASGCPALDALEPIFTDPR